MAGLWYLTWAFVVLGPLWRDGDARLDNLWYLYMSPAFDEQPASRLWVLAGPSLLLGLAGLVNPYSRRLSECLSHPRVARGLAAAALVLAWFAWLRFSAPVAIGYAIGAGLWLWAWRRADPDDGWF